MLNFLIFISIGILFYLLSKSADLVVDSVRKIGHAFNIPIIFLGFILGFLTSLPELSIAVSASAKNLSDLSLGNLLGGISVLFGLILGVSIFFSRPISTDGNYKTILPILGYSFLPFLLGLNGEISFFEGVFLVVMYFVLVVFLFEEIGHKDVIKPITHHHSPSKQIIFSLVGIVSLLIVSNLIIRLTETLLESYNISAFFIGLILFSLGTNLPEIAVSFRSIRKHVAELSLASIFGSVIANPLIVGILSIIQPVPIEQTGSYIALSVSTGILLLFVFRFYETGKKFSKKEGALLVLLYLGIIAIQIIAS
ncbi:MAG: inner membrane protein [Parcubacteria group bacterium LiPW_41]|nr:MAG: inner membrane protein [Parcubacteria group bacterium LiPW_41]